MSKPKTERGYVRLVLKGYSEVLMKMRADFEMWSDERVHHAYVVIKEYQEAEK